MPTRRTTVAALTAAMVMAAAPAAAQTAPAARSIDNACPPGGVVEDEFVDVPSSNVHEAAVDCVVWWEVALGTSATSYDPAGLVERGQMASFLVRLILNTGGELPSADGSPDAFTDDGGGTHEAATNQLAAAGIVSGTGGGRFDPGGNVSRAQMATFLVAAIEYRSGVTLTADGDAFTDDDGSTHEASINEAAAAGITGGAAAGGYRPGLPVARDQMASFLARSLDFLVTGEVASAKAPAAGPGDAKDCADFATQVQAQTWFDYYFPTEGDVAMLDQDGDGVACESLP